MITLKRPDLPDELSQLDQPPARLYASSDDLARLMALPRIGVVGSRKFTVYGKTVTTQIVRELTRRGVVIVSGLALGIDSIAHTACVQNGGQTIAVLPAGLDVIYPRTHSNLAAQITRQGGLLVTEYPVGSEPYKVNFLARNRIIAALSEGLLIPEAAARSGSLNTARMALELGKPVFAIPGPITSPTSEGTNNLIKAGAIPVTGVQDIFAALGWRDSTVSSIAHTASTEEERIVLQLLVAGVGDGHELLTQSRLEAAKFHQTLTMLELTGRIRPLGGNYWALN